MGLSQPHLKHNRKLSFIIISVVSHISPFNGYSFLSFLSNLISQTTDIVAIKIAKALTLITRIEQTMKEEKTDRQEKTGRTPLDRLCCTSGLLLSIACCIALIHVEFRIQEQQRLISKTTTVCDQMDTEILRKLRQNFQRWGRMERKKTQRNTGRPECVVL